jgi:hypothetical protein
MAAGDVVNGIGVGVGVQLFFQPAVNVEVVVTFISSISIGTFGIYDGVNSSTSYSGYNTTNLVSSNIKLPITNTLYLTVNSNGVIPSFSGIQIK